MPINRHGTAVPDGDPSLRESPSHPNAGEAKAFAMLGEAFLEGALPDLIPPNAEGGEPKPLPQRLAVEIARVSGLRAVYQALDGSPGVNVKPAILLMTYAIERAIGSGEAVDQLSALAALEGFTD